MIPLIHIIKNPAGDDARDLWGNPLHGLYDPQTLAARLGHELGTLKHLSRAPGNYYYFNTITGGKRREVSSPKPRLEDIQRRISDFLGRLRPPDYLHSGVPKRSHVTHALVHLGQPWLCTVDLKTFYRQVTADDVQRLFSHYFMCSNDVANLLTRLCTLDGHLPIGARTSQPLAFWVCKTLLDDLSHLARTRGLLFSAYVDDLCFSGEDAKPAFLWEARKRIHAHGWVSHHARCFGPGRPRTVTGVVLTDQGPVLRAADARRIRRARLGLGKKTPTSSEMQRLIGQLSAAKQVDPRCGGLLESVRRRFNQISPRADLPRTHRS